ncbi:MAG TPA: 6-phosphofructokinase [Dermatophilaceae bacterium]|nr:6-phosphofructokinase [Dermatophilaceae bacterium]
MTGATVRIGVLTSGGDAQGMNAAVRAVARAAVRFGAEVYAVMEGWQGAVDGGAQIRRLGWDDVSGIQHLGGTAIGTARCPAFRERDGRRQAAGNLVRAGIDRLVVIGGDGSLSGADELAQEWPTLLDELVDAGQLSREVADAHPVLTIAGLVGSIDNDMVGTDMTIGADSALHRILEAVDAIASTAASHQRSFVIEVMGRRCGYLALAAAIAGGCDYALIPEQPLAEGWEDEMCAALRRERTLGRRESMVLVAEGARDLAGEPVSGERVRRVIQERLHEETRVTILGHVQRGGTPSAFDRSMATMMGYAAVEDLLVTDGRATTSQIIGIRRNRVRRAPLVRAVKRNREIGAMLDTGRHAEAMAARGNAFAELFGILRAIARPEPETATGRGRRIGIVHGGGLAPGMNTAARAAVRLGHDRGHTMLGVENGLGGLARGRVRALALPDVEGWSGLGGAELGTRRGVVDVRSLYDISRSVEDNELEALLVIGGWDAYESVRRLQAERDRYPALDIPIVCLPASIDNNLPGSELSVGADTAVNAIVQAIDRIKQSAMAARRCFVIETMGRECGYLALMAAMSTGAEQVYLPEEGIDLPMLEADVRRMRSRFEAGRRLFVAVRGEGADEEYTTDVVGTIFQAEARGLYDVRRVVLAHIQQGGDPSPFDRVLATRFAARAIDRLAERLEEGSSAVEMLGLQDGALDFTPMSRIDEVVDWEVHRPKDQWWLGLLPVVRELADAPEGALPSAERLSDRPPSDRPPERPAG